MPNRSSARRRTPGRALRLHDVVRLSAAGPAKVLGDLEARVLHVIWDLDRPASARDVYERVARRHDVQLPTVITVLNRLVTKGVLRRVKRDALYHYEAAWSEADFTAEAARHMMAGVLAFGPGVITAALVDVLAERDPDRLVALGRMAERRLEALATSNDEGRARSAEPSTHVAGGVRGSVRRREKT